MPRTGEEWFAATQAYYAEERAHDVRPVSVREARRRHRLVSRSVRRRSRTVDEIASESDLIAPYYLERMIIPDVHGSVLARFATIIEERTPAVVLDAGCGIGMDLCFLAHAFPTVEFIGSDVSPEMLRRTSDRAVRRGCTNARIFRGAHAALMDEWAPGTFQLIYTNGSLIPNDLADLRAMLRSFHTVLHTTGALVVVQTVELDRDVLGYEWTELGGKLGSVRVMKQDGVEVCFFGILEKGDRPCS